MSVGSPLYQATEELVAAEKELAFARSAEGKQLRKLKKETDGMKDAQKEFENSLRETVRSMSFSDLGKQLKKDLMSPLEGMLNSLPAPVKTLGMMAMKPFLKKEEEPTGPGFRFDSEAGKDGKWKEFDEKTKTMKHSLSKGDTQKALDARAAEAGATVESHTLAKSDYDAAKAVEKAESSGGEGKKQTGLLGSIKSGIAKMVAGLLALIAWFKKKFAKPDSSKKAEDDIEAPADGGGGGDGGDGKKGGLFGGIGKTFKKIKSFIKKFISWKGMVVLLIGAIIGGLALKYWEPIKELVLEIKDKILSVYNTIKEWFLSIWNWALAAGTDEDGEWTVMTFISNIWNTIKGWFESLWSLALDGIAAGWTNVTDYISGIWNKVYGWFTGLWSWTSKDLAAGWTNLTTYIKGIWDTVYGWFTGLWSWASGGIAEGWTNLTDYITKIWTSVKAWFSKLFSWGEEDEKAGEGWSLSTLISGIFTGLKNWFFGLFGIDPKKGELSAEDFAKISEGFSLTNLLMKAVRGIGDFFWKGDGTGLLEFDLSGIKEKLFDMGAMFATIAKAGAAAFKAAWPGGESPGEAFQRVMKSGMDKGGVMTSDGKWTPEMQELADKEERVNNLEMKKNMLLMDRDSTGLTEDGEKQLAQLSEEVRKEKKELKSMPGYDSGRSGQELGKLKKEKEFVEASLEDSSINAMDTSKGMWVTQNQYDQQEAYLETINAKIKKLENEPDFILTQAGNAQIVAEKPTMQDAAISLANGGPKGNPRGMGNTSVVDASTSNSSTSNNSNTNVTVVNKLPVTASDPYTTKQDRRFRGMRGGGS